MPTLDGEGVLTLDGEGVPTLDGGGGTYPGWGMGGRGYLPWIWQRYLPWTGYAMGSTPLAASRRKTFFRWFKSRVKQ